MVGNTVTFGGHAAAMHDGVAAMLDAVGRGPGAETRL